MGVSEAAFVGVAAMFVVLVIVELVAPVRRYDAVPAWRAKCLAVSSSDPPVRSTTRG
jgi:hypothetical protein